MTITRRTLIKLLPFLPFAKPVRVDTQRPQSAPAEDEKLTRKFLDSVEEHGSILKAAWECNYRRMDYEYRVHHDAEFRKAAVNALIRFLYRKQQKGLA